MLNFQVVGLVKFVYYKLNILFILTAKSADFNVLLNISADQVLLQLDTVILCNSFHYYISQDGLM